MRHAQHIMGIQSKSTQQQWTQDIISRGWLKELWVEARAEGGTKEGGGGRARAQAWESDLRKPLGHSESLGVQLKCVSAVVCQTLI